MEISNLLRLTPRRVLVLLLFLAIGGGVGAAIGRTQQADHVGNAALVVSSLVGIDQPDYLAQSFTKSIADLVTLDSTSTKAARDVGIDASGAQIQAVVSDGGTKVDIEVTINSAKAQDFAVALGKEALAVASKIQTPLATTAKDSADAKQQDAIKALAGFDLQHGTDLADDASLPQSGRDSRRDLRAQRDVLSRAVDSAQKQLDDASSRLVESQLFTTMSTKDGVVPPAGLSQSSKSALLVKTGGGGAAAGLAVGLVLIILADRRSRRATAVEDGDENDADAEDSETPSEDGDAPQQSRGREERVGSPQPQSAA